MKTRKKLLREWFILILIGIAFYLIIFRGIVILNILLLILGLIAMAIYLPYRKRKRDS